MKAPRADPSTCTDNMVSSDVKFALQGQEPELYVAISPRLSYNSIVPVDSKVKS